MFETLDFTLRIGSTPTFLFFICIFNLHAHVAHYVYLTLENCVVAITVQKSSGRFWEFILEYRPPTKTPKD